MSDPTAEDGARSTSPVSERRSPDGPTDVGSVADQVITSDPADAALAAESVTIALTPQSVVNRTALRVSAAIGTAAKWIGATLLAVIIAVVSMSVWARYVQGEPLVWAEDISLRAFVWMSFLGLVYLIERQQLLSLPVLANRLSGRPRIMLAVGSNLIAAYVLWIMFDWGRIVLINVAGTRSAALGLPGWTLYSAAPAAGAICLLIVVTQLSSLIEMAFRGERT